MGANTAIFSAVDGVLLRPAPIADLRQLAMIWETDRNTGTVREPASLPGYVDFQQRSRRFESLAAFGASDVTLLPRSGEPLRLPALTITRSFLPLVGLGPIAGRNFTREEAEVNGPAAVLISESLWERLFGRDAVALGSTRRVDDRPRTIVGVVPDVAGFGVLQVLSAGAYSRGFADRGDRARVQIWMPLEPGAPEMPRSTHPIFVIGRLAPQTTIQMAQQEMNTIASDLERTYGENAARGAHVEGMADVVFGPVRPAFLVLLGAVALVLLISCLTR